ncbi:MAG: hypothetical protein KGJ06_08420, partial [Pseudomonadota bacterium]|nr:hypothetical protein [Pseudomonadota bacterium]
LAISDARYSGALPWHAAEGCQTESWDYRGIRLNCDEKNAGDLRIRQFYFGIWQASIDDHEVEGLHPEAHSGIMLLPVPAGRHEVRLTPSIDAVLGWRFILAKGVSLATITGLLVTIFMRRRRSGAFL